MSLWLKSQEKDMNSKLAIVAFCALALTVNEANALGRSAQTYVRPPSVVFGHRYGYAARDVLPGAIFGRAYGPAALPDRGLIFGPDVTR
jgi:hypothetical protein